jgi:hypothetical protein
MVLEFKFLIFSIIGTCRLPASKHSAQSGPFSKILCTQGVHVATVAGCSYCNTHTFGLLLCTHIVHLPTLCKDNVVDPNDYVHVLGIPPGVSN